MDPNKTEKGEKDEDQPSVNEDRSVEIRKVVKETNYRIINLLVNELMRVCRQLTTLRQFGKPTVAKKSPEKVPPEKNQKE